MRGDEEACAREGSPPRVFLELRILKGFKSCALEVHILCELRARFSELRIVKSLEKKARRRKNCGAEAPRLQRLGEELQWEKKSREGDGDWLVCPSRLRVNDENPSGLPSVLRASTVNMGKSSISLARR